MSIPRFLQFDDDTNSCTGGDDVSRLGESFCSSICSSIQSIQDNGESEEKINTSRPNSRRSEEVPIDLKTMLLLAAPIHTRTGHYRAQHEKDDPCSTFERRHSTSILRRKLPRRSADRKVSLNILARALHATDDDDDDDQPTYGCNNGNVSSRKNITSATTTMMTDNNVHRMKPLIPERQASSKISTAECNGSSIHHTEETKNEFCHSTRFISPKVAPDRAKRIPRRIASGEGCLGTSKKSPLRRPVRALPRRKPSSIRDNHQMLPTQRTVSGAARSLRLIARRESSKLVPAVY